MPRKSSFLMGFETGSALMRGAQADARARQQTAMNARLNERRLQAMDAELRAEQEKRDLLLRNRTRATNALEGARNAFNSLSGEATTPDQQAAAWTVWAKARGEYVGDIALSPTHLKAFEAWEDGLKEGQLYKSWSDLRAAKDAKRMAAVNASIKKTQDAATTIANANNIAATPIELDDPEAEKKARTLNDAWSATEEAIKTPGTSTVEQFRDTYLMEDGKPLFSPTVMALAEKRFSHAAMPAKDKLSNAEAMYEFLNKQPVPEELKGKVDAITAQNDATLKDMGAGGASKWKWDQLRILGDELSAAVQANDNDAVDAAQKRLNMFSSMFGTARQTITVDKDGNITISEESNRFDPQTDKPTQRNLRAEMSATENAIMDMDRIISSYSDKYVGWMGVGKAAVFDKVLPQFGIDRWTNLKRVKFQDQVSHNLQPFVRAHISEPRITDKEYERASKIGLNNTLPPAVFLQRYATIREIYMDKLRQHAKDTGVKPLILMTGPELLSQVGGITDQTGDKFPLGKEEAVRIFSKRPDLGPSGGWTIKRLEKMVVEKKITGAQAAFWAANANLN